MKSVKSGAFGSLLKTGITKVCEFGSKHSHIISAGVGIVSIVATGYFAYKARPKMDVILDEAREKMDALNRKANDISENYRILFEDKQGFGVDIRLCKEHLTELKEILDKELSE